MSFDDLLNKYKVELFGEAGEVPPAPAWNSGMAPPAPPIGDPGMGEPQPTPELSPEDKKEMIGKLADKPWSDLASVLAKAMSYQFDEQKLNIINAKLPEGFSLSSFVNLENPDSEESIEDKYSSEASTAAVTLFEVVKKIMSDGGANDVPRAENY